MRQPCRRGRSRPAVGGLVLALACLAAVTCGRPEGASNEPPAIRLVDDLDGLVITDSPADVTLPEQTVWRFDGTGTVTPPEAEAEAEAEPEPEAETEAEAEADADADAEGEGDPDLPYLPRVGAAIVVHGIEHARIEDGLLKGTVTDPAAMLAFERPETLDGDDLVHAVQIRSAASAGTEVGLTFFDDEGLDDVDKIVERIGKSTNFFMTAELQPGDEPSTRTISADQTSFSPSYSLADSQFIVVRPSEEVGAEFTLESVRLITRREHLASVPSGLGWHGLDEIYRETLVARAPETLIFEVSLPSHPWLDLSLGTIEKRPLTFEVSVESNGRSDRLLKRTLTTPNRWEVLPLDLAPYANRTVTLNFTLGADEPGTMGFWGGLVVRNRGASPRADAPSPARAALADGGQQLPQGVIVVIMDTLRRDHLQLYGYARETAPHLAAMAADGAVFEDNISQGTWTKISVPSILTSLYPSTHGLVDTPDRIPASVTTLAEAFQAAGYATFATSSVPFTGKLSNLHQGVEVLHERPSLPDMGKHGSKTARIYVDRLAEFIEGHRDVPFFAMLHVFDPHSPFEPYEPWNTTWADAADKAAHTERVEKVSEFMDSDFMKRQGLPRAEDLEAAEIDPEVFVETEHAWYDGSIRGMDTEIARLVERLEGLGLGERTLMGFIADHGEEFLEHGRHWHGNTTYGEMVNVPLMVWWPGVVPAARVEPTVMSIDMLPTLLDLARVPTPDEAQGQSLVPLLASPGDAADSSASLGFRPRPAFSERAVTPHDPDPEPIELGSYAVVWEGWKLIHNVERPEDWPEYELYDHEADPLNTHDVAAENADIVERLAAVLDAWRVEAEAARVEADDAASLSDEERAQLEALGYIR